MALLATPALVTTADASPLPGPAVPCLQRSTDTDPPVRRLRDTSPVSAATLARVEREVDAADPVLAESVSPSVRSAAAQRLFVNVQVHIIHGRHKGERRIKRPAARRLVQILRDGYNGAQWPGVSEPMGVVFNLKRITITRNDRWYHAWYMSRADRQMRRHLHRGTAQTLNIYIKTFKKSSAGVLLGHSRFPWQYRGHKKMDGVEINVDGMPGGRARGYNLGDTVVHETGHWFGLLHTFQNFCDANNDYVADTPAESYYATSCGDITNICNPTDLVPAPGGPGYYNPSLNFMEYTPDACMRMFTKGQHERLVRQFLALRYGR
jgi:hypothetical protein